MRPRGDELHALAEEQAALRRVATLVATGASPAEVFAAVVDEVGKLLPVESASMARYESDALVFVAASGPGAHPFPVGARQRLGGKNLGTIVFETGRPARLDGYADTTSGPLGVGVRAAGIRSSVATPIIVEGRLWGVIAAGSVLEHPLPANSEARLGSFTELVATAVANAESRAELARLAEEQAALRRVATLVARGTQPEEVFAAVTEEVGTLLGADLAAMARREKGDTLSLLATWGAIDEHPDVETRSRLEGGELARRVLSTGRPARIEGNGGAPAHLALLWDQLGIRSSVASPIVVDGQVWGGLVVHSKRTAPLPADTEARLGSFTELVATAIANADSRAALTASRARIVAAADESRRKIERDLHDGAQQRLVHAVIVMKLALRALSTGAADAGELVAEALRHADEANTELRELPHGILPASLTRGGLRAGVDALVSRLSLPVSVDVAVERLPAGVEATAYFVVSEALTNVVKHAHAGGAGVIARIEARELRVEVRDDGVGGARGDQTSGLGGLRDRGSALGGSVLVESPPGGGTRVCALLPVASVP